MPTGEANAAKTHCPNGHPYSGDNLRIAQCSTGERRVCRQCVRDKARERRKGTGKG